jgi:hypothetical protein
MACAYQTGRRLGALEEGNALMAYQPPGPYPVMPMQPVYGLPQRPPIPQAALRSYYAILGGAALSVVDIIITFTEIGDIRTQVRQQLPGYSASTINTAVNIDIAAVAVGGLLGTLLWLWMAWKIKTGRHWARVLSSVFFGISVLSALAGGINYTASEKSGSTSTTTSIHTPVAGTILSWLTVAVGLYALVMFWHKTNAAFFRPQKFAMPGYPYPYPPQGYPPAQYPQVPGQGGYLPGQGQDGTPQQPNDPWNTPPQ